MRTALATLGILGLRAPALAAVIVLGFAATGPAVASSDEIDPAVAAPTAIGNAGMADSAEGEATVAVVDHVFEISLSEKLEIKAAAETFVWGLSNRHSSAVWMIAPEVERARFGSEDALYGFFSRIHPPLANARSIVFDSITSAGNLPVVNIYVIDTVGLQWRASFGMARNTAGHWTIMSSRLLPAPGDLV